jgi:hypothetical protein
LLQQLTKPRGALAHAYQLIIKDTTQTVGMAQVREYSPSKTEALRSIPSTSKLLKYLKETTRELQNGGDEKGKVWGRGAELPFPSGVHCSQYFHVFSCPEVLQTIPFLRTVT